MLKEFVEKIVGMAEPTLPVLEGRQYTDRPLQLIKPPRSHAPLDLMTLTGLVDAVRVKLDDLAVGNWVIEVLSHEQVRLVSRCTNSYGEREILLSTTLTDGKVFPFGTFLQREEFVIGLQSRFVSDDELRKVLQLASSLEASTVALAEDDGISQRTTVKQGVALKQDVTVRGRVTLRPFRTFREVEQPASEFVFRLRSQHGAVPDCALFEADGGKWRLDAVLTIKGWLDAKQLGIPVVA